MKRRGETYRQWRDPILHHQTHEETLGTGTCLDVQTRLSRTGATQLFIGVYRADGSVVCEQIHAQRAGETMSRALVWGVGYARRVAGEGEAFSVELAGD
ncbi:hypothetical protein P0Y43_02135 [Pseudomonas entomophila]|uniref:hypothetical protein n=1 Tax=Pseudomonas entomophila TaxID=312306 RepID=UPI0023D88225|nr:hypothetical protein [Pseudomonas entomophila]MDF0729526.1 hypothetical protein [Pseudomonas entomophila]